MPSVIVTVNGTTFIIPETGDSGWGDQVTGWIQAVSANTLQKTGGEFTLVNDIDFGDSFGLISTYFKSASNNISTTGVLRLANDDCIGWRNSANDGDLLLCVDGDTLEFNSFEILTTSGGGGGGSFNVSDTSTIDLTLAANTLSADLIVGGITNAYVSDSASIGRHKLEAGTPNRLAYWVPSSGTLGVLSSITSNRALKSDANGLPVASTVTATALEFLDATSSVQTQLDNLMPISGGEFTGAVNFSSGAITFAGISNENLVDKTASESITGAWDFDFLTVSGIPVPLVGGDGVGISSVNSETGPSITIGGAGEVSVTTASNVVTISGTPHPAISGTSYSETLVEEKEKHNVIHNLGTPYAGFFAWDTITGELLAGVDAVVSSGINAADITIKPASAAPNIRVTFFLPGGELVEVDLGNYILVRQDDTSGDDDPQGFNVGGFEFRRNLDSIQFDDTEEVQIGNDQFTTSDATYRFFGKVPMNGIGASVGILYNSTGLSISVVGTATISPTNFQPASFISTQFTDIASIEREFRDKDSGLGTAALGAGIREEVFTQGVLRKNPVEDFIQFQYLVASGNDAGSSSAGTWTTRELNTLSIDTTGGASLSSNQMTVPAGTYYFFGAATGYATGRNQLRFIDSATSGTLFVGNNAQTGSVSNLIGNTTTIDGIFTASGVPFELQHRFETANADDGLGKSASHTTSDLYVFADFLKLDNSNSTWAHIVNEQLITTDAGTLTGGVDTVVPLNTITYDNTGVVSLSSNVITLGRGTWIIRAFVPGCQVNAHQAYFWDEAGATTALLGTSEDSGFSATMTYGWVEGKVIVASATKDFTLRIQSESSRSGVGLGIAHGFGTERYASILLEKVG